ncbi:hypothetical protein NQZ79_g5918 [Umbelopsis isabellina]|nr:hypothetical protein NQZ79_g5918 [Umbelopsis isabellina]
MPKLEVTKSYTIPAHESTKNGPRLQLVIEQHSFPAKAPTAATRTVNILWSHANGFHKETLHPLMRRVANQLNTDCRNINFEFYGWDARNHGDSARLNEKDLPETFSWQDHAFDIRQIVEVLELKTPESQLIGVGHSVGATATILCEFRFPGTFDAILALEPIMSVQVLPEEVRKASPWLSSRKRRDTWDSTEDAYKFFSNRKFWKTWDPEVLDLFVEYGLYQDDNGKVRLKCSPEQEYAIYCPLDELKHFDDIAPTGTYTIVKGGHLIPLEDLDTVTPPSDAIPQKSSAYHYY